MAGRGAGAASAGTVTSHLLPRRRGRAARRSRRAAPPSDLAPSPPTISPITTGTSSGHQSVDEPGRGRHRRPGGIISSAGVPEDACEARGVHRVDRARSPPCSTPRRRREHRAPARREDRVARRRSTRTSVRPSSAPRRRRSRAACPVWFATTTLPSLFSRTATPPPSSVKPSSLTTTVCQGRLVRFSERRAVLVETQHRRALRRASRPSRISSTLAGSEARTRIARVWLAKKPRKRCTLPRDIPAPASTSARWRARPLQPLPARPTTTMSAKHVALATGRPHERVERTSPPAGAQERQRPCDDRVEDEQDGRDAERGAEVLVRVERAVHLVEVRRALSPRPAGKPEGRAGPMRRRPCRACARASTDPPAQATTVGSKPEHVHLAQPVGRGRPVLGRPAGCPRSSRRASPAAPATGRRCPRSERRRADGQVPADRRGPSRVGRGRRRWAPRRRAKAPAGHRSDGWPAPAHAPAASS